MFIGGVLGVPDRIQSLPDEFYASSIGQRALHEYKFLLSF